MEKIKVSQDTLYQFIQDHGIKLVRLAELTGISEASINSCFKHYLINHGVPRSFTAKGLSKINAALQIIAADLRRLLLTFDSERAVTNKWGRAYDRGLVEPMKLIGVYFNLTALCDRVLNWSQGKKENILVIPSSKVYGNISEADVTAINTELLTVAGVLSSWEVVSDADLRSGS